MSKTTVTTEVRNGRTMTVTTTEHPIPEPASVPVVQQYGPEWLAACYGLDGDDLLITSPRVAIAFPDWAPLTACAQ